MVKFVLQRFTGCVGVLLAISLLAHVLIYLAPGDPAVIILAQRIGQLPNPEQVDQLRKEYGLDGPPIMQYFSWLGQAIQGNFGYSIRTGNPVLEEIQLRLGPTLLLAGVTTSLAVILGLPIGFLAAWRKNSFWDHVTRTIALLGVSIPNFWLAFLLILVFSITLRWLPTHGIGEIKHLILPVVCLGLADMSRLSRLVRSGFIEIQHEEYLLAARAKGLHRHTAWLRHGIPNIAVPLITVIATQFSYIVAGSVIIETLFAWPGIGNLYITSVNYRDIPVIQTMLLSFGAVFVVLNFVADLAYVAIDPRIRLK